MSKDDTSTWHLTADGWKEADDPPDETVHTAIFHEPMKMYQRGYWEDVPIPGADAETVRALQKKYGRHPR